MKMVKLESKKNAYNLIFEIGNYTQNERLYFENAELACTFRDVTALNDNFKTTKKEKQATYLSALSLGEVSILGGVLD
jgi:hypothetical protein